MSTADEIKKLNDLLRDGVLSQEEFDKQKDKLLNSNSISTSQQDWLVALLLCFFIGVIGAHRFYVGKIGTGLLMVFTLGGLGIWTFIDLILIIVGKFKNKDGEVLSRI
jgi:TM2 domain-containing membrane protein YozV